MVSNRRRERVWLNRLKHRAKIVARAKGHSIISRTRAVTADGKSLYMLALEAATTDDRVVEFVIRRYRVEAYLLRGGRVKLESSVHDTPVSLRLQRLMSFDDRRDALTGSHLDSPYKGLVWVSFDSKTGEVDFCVGLDYGS